MMGSMAHWGNYDGRLALFFHLKIGRLNMRLAAPEFGQSVAKHDVRGVAQIPSAGVHHSQRSRLLFIFHEVWLK